VGHYEQSLDIEKTTGLTEIAQSEDSKSKGKEKKKKQKWKKQRKQRIFVNQQSFSPLYHMPLTETQMMD
jgi:hypothetical protein